MMCILGNKQMNGEYSSLLFKPQADSELDGTPSTRFFLTNPNLYTLQDGKFFLRA